MNSPYKPKRSKFGQIIDGLVEGNLPKRLWNGFLKYFGLLLAMPSRLICGLGTEVDPKKIMFMTYSNKYICNPKYICEELINRDLDLKIVWAVNKKDDFSVFPENIKLVIRNTAPFFREQATSKIWIENALSFVWKWFPKKRSQVYFQTWHGSMGLKRVGAQDVGNRRWVRKAKRAGRITDYCISNSVFEDAVFRETYWPKTEILHYGHARNDLLLINDQTKKRLLKEKISEIFEFDYSDNIALYAPTFRDNEEEDFEAIDYALLQKSLQIRFGGKWLILTRLHFHDRKKIALGRVSEEVSVIDVTEYNDMQELLLVADVGITDYSSWICDYVLTSRPAFIYAYDLEEYNNARGFYYPLESTPFPVATDNNSLSKAIKEFDEIKYQEDCLRFLHDRGSYESGIAAKEIVDQVLSICK